MITFDYHTHSNHSPDSTTLISDMLLRAIDIGITEYAITDHMDFAYPASIYASHNLLDAYVKDVQSAQKKFAGQINILLGIEFGLRPDCAAVTSQIAESYDFDFIIGSMHEDTKGFDFGFAQFFRGRTKREAYTTYFESILETVNACDAFDVLGHMDYIERYGRFEDKSLHYKDYKEIIDEILKVVIAKGKGIEINTSGYAYGLGHPHPRLEILKRYKELGGEILTIGSDCHHPRALAQHFEHVPAFLAAADIKYITRFKKREPIFTKIL